MQSDTTPAKDEKGESTDAPVQGKDSEKPQPLADTPQSQPDASQSADSIQPKPESKEKSSGGGGCTIENPNDSSVLNALAVLGATALAWASRRRRRIQGVLTSQH